MNFLLSSAPMIAPFWKKHGTEDGSVKNIDDDMLASFRSQRQDARRGLEEAINTNEEDDDSVRAILNDSGLPQRRTKKNLFDYRAADARIKEREADAQRRKDEMQKRLKLKEQQLFTGLQLDGDENLEGNETDDDVESIDAVMRKHDPKVSLKPSPLPASPPDNIKRWRHKIQDIDYELPSQEEQRLQRELKQKKTRNAKEGLSNNSKATNFDGDEFYSFQELTPSPRKNDASLKLKELMQEKHDLRQLLQKKDDEIAYWKHRFELSQLENGDLEQKLNQVQAKLARVNIENGKLYRQAKKTVQTQQRSPLSPVRASNRISFDMDDTTQLIKFASSSYVK